MRQDGLVSGNREDKLHNFNFQDSSKKLQGKKQYQLDNLLSNSMIQLLHSRFANNHGYQITQ